MTHLLSGKPFGNKGSCQGAPGFEPGTSWSAVKCSTPELYPLPPQWFLNTLLQVCYHTQAFHSYCKFYSFLTASETGEATTNWLESILGPGFTFAAPEAPPLSKRYLSILVATTLPAAGREAPCLRTRAFRVETPPPQRSSSLSSSPSSSDPAPRSAPASLPQPPSFPDPPWHTQLSRPGARLKRCPRGWTQGRLEERWRQDPLGSTIGEPKTRRSVQLLSRVRLFVTPWTAALQASLSITISQRLLKLVHWVSDAIQPSHLLSSPSPHAFNLSQHQGLFQWVSSSHQVAKVSESQLQHQSFQWMFRTLFPLRLTGWISLQSKGLLSIFSNTTVQKHQFFGAQPSLWSNCHIHTWLLEKA